MRMVKSGIYPCVAFSRLEIYMRDKSCVLQAILGGIGGAVKGIFGPVINIARKV